MQKEIINQVKKTILENHLVKEGDSLVLGLSGGPDSVSLLHVLNALKDELKFSLKAFHVNHMIRGEEADSDEVFAKSECEKLGIPFESIAIDVPRIAKENGESLEECGRKERQKALLSYAKENNSKVVLAHNLDDQAETVMLRILRGTGVHGLAGMEYKRDDGIIRPLLDVRRLDIEKYCEEEGITAHIDSTNKSTEYLRNKVRLEILPELSKINPSIKDSLVRLSSSSREDDEYLQSAAERWFLYNCTPNDLIIVLDVKALLSLEKAIFQRVVKIAFSYVGLNEDIAAVHINALRSVLESNVGNKTVEFPNGYVAFINHGFCNFKKA